MTLPRVALDPVMLQIRDMIPKKTGAKPAARGRLGQVNLERLTLRHGQI